MRQVVERLAELAGEPMPANSMASSRREWPDDVVVQVGRFAFVIEWRGTGTVASVSAAVAQSVRLAERAGPGAHPLVAVPYMGEVGRRCCEQAGVSWLDLSGNASLSAPGLRVLIEGRPNRFKRRGRPASAFAPKSSRIARWLLMHPNRFISQRQIARATDMDEGFTSRIVAKLEDDGLIERGEGGGIRASDSTLLLDAWTEAYDFSRHRIRRGHVPARSGDALLRQLSDVLEQAGVEHAATGLGAAWLLTHFAAFRIVSIYLREEPESDTLGQVAFREDPKGGNVWLVTPADGGVFHGSARLEGIRCVHPIQVYLDLMHHPERANEAAERLRTQFLTWSEDG